jgi:hypothetical protein
MKKINLGQTIGIVANIGVLVGLLLLVFELQQSREMMEAQTRHAVSQGIVDQLGELASNADLADLQHRAQCGKLNSSLEERRFRSFVNSRLRYWEDVHYQYRRGLYAESEFLAQTQAWRAFLRFSAVSENWKVMKGGFAPEFVEHIDALIVDSRDLQFDLGQCQ